MPGVQEIRQCIDALESSSIPKATVLPLHANLSNEEQKRVFKAITGRKIVVATNVAEVSRPIPYCFLINTPTDQYNNRRCDFCH